MKTKIKLLCFALLLILLLSTMSFATTDASLISTINTTDAETSNNVTENEIVQSENIVTDETSISPSETEPISETEELNYINDDYYYIGDDFSLEKDVNGNVYLIGDKIDLKSGTIAGNVFIIANEVNINSDIYMSLYVMADKINIESGEIVDAYLMANSINVDKEVFIDRNAKIASDSLDIDGEIFGNLYCISQNIKINGTIDGKLTYSGNLNQEEEARINEVEKKEIPTDINLEESFNSFVSIIKRIILVWKIITGTIVILVIFLLTKNCIKINNIDDDKVYYIDKKFDNSDMVTIIKGLLYIVIMFVSIIGLLITIIGIPASLLLFLVYIVTIYIAMPVSSIEIAELLGIKAKSEGKLKAIVALCSIVIYVIVLFLAKIPTIGTLISFIVTLYGLGSIVNFVFFRKEKNNKNETSNDSDNNINKDEIKEELLDSDTTLNNSKENDNSVIDSNNDNN